MKSRHVRLAVVLLIAGLALAIAAIATQQMVEDEREVSIEEVPADVMTTILAEAEGAAIGEIEMDTEDGQVVYEAEVIIDGQEVDIEVAADGTLLGKEADEGEDDEDDEADDEDDDEEEEQIVSMDAIPEAVKATLEKEAAGAEIKEVDMETEDGVTVYEAEVIVDGQEVDIKVAADGTLLAKEVENEDEADDD